MNNEQSHAVKHAAVFYYEWHSEKKDTYQIHIRFPDLLAIGLPAFSVGMDYDDTVKAAREILEMVLKYAADNGITIPEPSTLEKVEIDRGLNEIVEPYRIVVEYISLDSE